MIKSTKFIEIKNPQYCIACWACIRSCPNEVLGKYEGVFGRSVEIVNPEACISCMKCIYACDHGVFSKITK